MELTLYQKRYECIDVPADGNCLLHSLCCHPFFDIYNHKSLRSELVSRLKVAYNRDKLFHTKLNRINSDSQHPKFKNYSKYISRVGTWIGSQEVLLICYLFRVNIRIVKATDTLGQFIVSTTSHNLVTLRLLCEKEVPSTPVISILFHRFKQPLGKDSPQHPSNHYLFLSPLDDTKEDTKEQLRIIKESNQKNAMQIIDVDAQSNTKKKKKKRSKPTCVSKGKFKTRKQKSKKPKLPFDEVNEKNAIVNIDVHPTRVTKKNVTGRKHRTRGEWFVFANLYHKSLSQFQTQKAFLASPISNPLTERDRSAFSRKYSEFLRLERECTKVHVENRIYACHHAFIDHILLEYINSREKSARFALTWKELQLLAKKAWLSLSPEMQHTIGKFTASTGYISAFLKRNNIKLKSHR